jgi:hypothetical protein
VVRVGGDDKEQSDGCGVERWGRGFVTSAFEAKAVYARIHSAGFRALDLRGSIAWV